MNQLEAINTLAERTHESAERMRLNNYQRRNKVVDINGSEIHRIGAVDAIGEDTISAQFNVMVSRDLVYFERFEFKIIIEYVSVETPDPSPVPTEFRLLVEGIDITNHLAAQFGGNWITGVGIYPDEGLGSYDILKAVGAMTPAERNTILRPGFKRFVLRSNAPFTGTMIMYFKYSHVNR